MTVSTVTATRLRPQKDIPGPKPMPILGWKGTVLSYMHNPLQGLESLKNRYGEIAAVPAGGNSESGTGTVVIFGSVNNRILLSRADTFYNRPAAGVAAPDQSATGRKRVLLRLGPGLFGMNGPEHRHQRTDVTPAFHKNSVPFYHEVMVEEAERMLSGWAPGTVQEIWSDLMSVTLSVLAKTLLQIDLGEKAPALSLNLLRWLNQASKLPVMLFQSDVPGTPYWHFLNLSEQVEQEMTTLIKQIPGGIKYGEKNVLSMLSRRQNPSSGCPFVSDDELCGHLIAFLLAGQTTAPTLVAWTLLLIAQHPNVAEKLYDEIEKALGGRSPSIEDIDRMPYLEKVIKETMRIFPPVPITGRYLVEPVEMSGYQLQTGSDVICSIFHAHRDPAIYKDPLAFNPARWHNLQPEFYEYLPFSAGAHNCIGSIFAMRWMMIVLALIMQRFRLCPVPGRRIDVAVKSTSFPKSGMPMAIFKADGHFGSSRSQIKGNVNWFLHIN